MTSTVYFTSARAKMGLSVPKKFRRLLLKAGLHSTFSRGEFVAIKVHWGELYNTGYLRPIFARVTADEIKRKEGVAFVTDTNVVYHGHRHDAVNNLITAFTNGYSYSSVGVPLIVADGLTGRDSVEVPVEGGAMLKSAKIAGSIHSADAMVVLSHFKGHLLFGYAAALKNLGMGCATPAGKQILHSDVHPHVERDACVACGHCIEVCPEAAITLTDAGSKRNPTRKAAFIDQGRCIGCGECVSACPPGAIPVNWETSQEPLMKKTAEYAKAALHGKEGKLLFVNFLFDISPDCDCFEHSDLPFVPNLGIVASTDPVAVDQASIDLVNKATVIPGSVMGDKADVEDKIFHLKGRDYSGILQHAEELGMGTRKYKLIKI